MILGLVRIWQATRKNAIPCCDMVASRGACTYLRLTGSFRRSCGLSRKTFTLYLDSAYLYPAVVAISWVFQGERKICRTQQWLLSVGSFKANFQGKLLNVKSNRKNTTFARCPRPEPARVIIRLEEQLPQTFDAPCILLVVYQLAFSSF